MKERNMKKKHEKIKTETCLYDRMKTANKNAFVDRVFLLVDCITFVHMLKEEKVTQCRVDTPVLTMDSIKFCII